MTMHPATPAVAPAPLLRARGLARRHGSTPVFAGVDLDLVAGECIALVGESGVGKSTLLNVVAGLDRPDAGTVVLTAPGEPPVDVTALDADACARWRRRHLGFVFQAFHVLPYLDVAENVALPLALLGRSDPGRVAQVLAAVGLADLGARLPAQLSGGQLQRVAIARAVVHRPALILADEPTGNLDPATAERVMALLGAQVREAGCAMLLVTHSRRAAATADRIVRLTPSGIVAA